jgi:NAD(P)-dependent dehydrogenase (short-subunit alcohol dehydrogenase family)
LAKGAKVAISGRRDEAELQAMVDVTAPILLTRAAPPARSPDDRPAPRRRCSQGHQGRRERQEPVRAFRDSSDAMRVNVYSDIALVGAPFYETYATVTAGLAYFGEAPRRELKREGIHVLTVSSAVGRTPMMKSNRAGPEPGFTREPASAVADAIAEGIETGAFEVIRSGQAPAQIIALNRENPGCGRQALARFEAGARGSGKRSFGALSARQFNHGVQL